jgi:hypothetical protein
MSLRQSALTPLAMAGFIFISAAPSLGDAQKATFDLYISGIRAGEMTLKSVEKGGSYSAASRIQAAGFIGKLAKFFFDGTAKGSIRGDGVVIPSTYVAESKSSRADRHTEIDWKNGTPTRVSVEPPRNTAPDPAAQGGTLDPVSAGFALLRDARPGKICNMTVDIFDGSRRSRLKLGKPVENDKEYVCAGKFSRIKGEAHNAVSKREFPFEVVFRKNGDGAAQLKRIQTQTKFGKAVVERRG